MSYVADQVAATFTDHGKTMTLERAGESDLDVMGKRLGGSLDEAGNSATQQQFRLLISNAELAASTWNPKEPSADTDTVMVNGRRRKILNAEPREHDGVIAMWELTVAG